MAVRTLVTQEDVRDYFFPDTPVPLWKNFVWDASEHTKVVVHIGARSGSTRLPDKNIKELGGLPLIAYSILMAKAMGVDRIILNTDSEAYREIGLAFGADVPFLRPEELSGDLVAPGPVSYYAARRVLQEEYPLGTWIEMYPTSPFRSLPVMRRFLDIVSRAGSCVSAVRVPAPCAKTYAMGQTAPFSLACDEKLIFFKALGTFIGKRLYWQKNYWNQYEMITDPAELIDLDTERDWNLAESILAAKWYDFGTDLC